MSLKEVPATLMRPKAPKAGKRVILERIPFLWKRFNFTWKVTVRNILRYKKRFFMSIVGIAGSCSLLVTGFGVKKPSSHRGPSIQRHLADGISRPIPMSPCPERKWKTCWKATPAYARPPQ